MPIYDYRCDSCGSTYDVFHKVREVEDDIICPSCNSAKHTRLLSAPNVSMGSSSSSSSMDFSAPSCESGGCCGGSCGIN
ncbi:MAG: zinc ribbon domain-containing protein [Ignavibacteriae bacterium]|nr:zinc ribbon domain-containing protein [Ignavibacteriota bacterium]